MIALAIARLPRPLRFAAVGALGFPVDVGVLYAMLAISLDYVSGRLVSFAVTFTWYLNRRFTFAALAVAAGSLSGLAFNYAASRRLVFRGGAFKDQPDNRLQER